MAAADTERLERNWEVAAQEEALRALRERTQRAATARRARERQRAQAVGHLMRAARDAWGAAHGPEVVPASSAPAQALTRPATGGAGQEPDQAARRVGGRDQAPAKKPLEAHPQGGSARPPSRARARKAPVVPAPLQFRLDCAGTTANPVRDSVGLHAGACWAEVVDAVARAVGRASHVGVIPHGASRPITCRSRRDDVLAPVGRVPSGGQSAVLRVVVMHKVKGGHCLCGRLASSLGVPAAARKEAAPKRRGRPRGLQV